MSPSCKPPRKVGTLELIDDEELCSRLRVDRRTTWRWRTRKRSPLPHVRLGGRILYDLDAVERWIRRQGGAA